MRFIGIQIERKTDILAFAAFLMSIMGLVLQVVNYIKGPDLALEKTRQIQILEPVGDEKYIRFSFKLVYLNYGSPGYDEIVKSEKAVLKLGEKSFSFFGQKYIESDISSGRLVIKTITDADPFQIKSGDVVSHETSFSAWSIKSGFLRYGEFLTLVEKFKKFEVEISSETFSKKLVKTLCEVNFEDYVAGYLEKKWASVPCINNWKD